MFLGIPTRHDRELQSKHGEDGRFFLGVVKFVGKTWSLFRYPRGGVLFFIPRSAEIVVGQNAMSSTPVERIRQAICAKLSRLANEPVASLHETILIRNGLYCGRKFQAANYEVVWFIEEDEIKFFGPCCNLLEAVSAVGLLDDRFQVVADLKAQPLEERRAA